MKKTLIVTTVIILMACRISGAGPATDVARQWPQFRGPLGTGVAPHGDPPVEWSEKTNIRWKTALPGLGHSSPIVWGDRVFVTSAVPFGEALAPPSEHDHEHDDGAHDNMPANHALKFVAMAVSDRRHAPTAPRSRHCR